MQLSFSQRVHLYRNLAMMLESGMSFLSSLRSLDHVGGKMGEVIRIMRTSPESAASAFSSVSNAWGAFDIRLIEASEKAGRLAEGFKNLADYYEARAQAKDEIIHQLIYPVIVLHLGIVLLSIPIFLEEGFARYLGEVGMQLGMVYTIALLVFFFFKSLLRWKSSVVWLDQWLRRLPILRVFFKDPEDGRFVFILSLQIRSGIPIRRALESAAETSESAWLKKVIPMAVQRIREGSRLAESVAHFEIHPMIVQSLRTGEESGRLSDQLEQVSYYLQQKNLKRLKLLGQWIPKIIYFIIVLIVAAQIISRFQKVLGGYQNILDQM